MTIKIFCKKPINSIIQNLAPIALFVYNRPNNLRRTLIALENNELAKESEIYIFADGPKIDATKDELKLISDVRNLIRISLKFKKVYLIENDVNNGLANSIILGVNKVIKKHGKVIVLEDDLITSLGFLRYMNKALNYYKDDPRVMQISGYQFPINKKAKSESFFLPLTTSWGWATWGYQWNKFTIEKENWNLSDFLNNKYNKYRFNFKDSYPFFEMLDLQLKKKIDSWAILWKFFVFKENGLILYPDKSLVKNIGFGIDSTHTKENLFVENNFNENYNISFFPKIGSSVKTKNLYSVSIYLKQKMNGSLNWKDKIKFILNFTVNREII